MTCKDCVHYEICETLRPIEWCMDKTCSRYKHKADFVEVKHGEWIKKERKYYPSYVCSVCGYSTPFDNGNYCKNCGAKMDGNQ